MYQRIILLALLACFISPSSSEAAKENCSVDSLHSILHEMPGQARDDLLLKNLAQENLDCILYGVNEFSASDSAVLAIAKEDFSEAIAILKSLISDDIDDSTAYRYSINIALAYLLDGQANEESADTTIVKQSYYECISSASKALLLWEESAEALMLQGYAFYNLGYSDSAALKFEHVLHIHPTAAEAIVAIAQINLEDGEVEKAISDFSAALRYDPQNHKALFWKAIALSHTGKTDEAMIFLDRLLDLYPYHILGLIQRSSINIEKGNYPRALEDLEMASTVAPEAALVWYNKGATYKEMGNLEEAQRYNDHALKVDPEFGPAWAFRGAFQYLYGNLLEAEKCINKALKWDPECIEALVIKCELLSRKQKHNEAVSCYEQLTSLDPQFTLGWVQLCVLKQVQGDTEGALKCCDSALKYDPSSTDARQIRKQITGK